MRGLLAILAPGVLCAAVAATPAAPARALSCVRPGVVAANAERLFAGNLLDSVDGRVLMDVREVWAGGPVLARVWLSIDDGQRMWSPWADKNGGAPDGYSAEQTWVVATGDDFTVGPCSLWPVSQVRELRPQHPTASVQPTSMPLDPAPPTPAETPFDDPGPTPAGLVAAGAGSAAGAGALGGLWVLRRRRNRP